MHLNVQKAILDETRHIAIGVLAADVIMCGIFLLLGQLDHTVVLGALWGSLFAVGNFFFMGLGVQKAMDMEDGAKRYMQKNYTLRMFFCVAGMAVAVKVPFFHSIAALVPFLFPKIVIYAMQLFGLYRPDEKKSTEGGEKAE